jgi:hypothetical protein
MNPKSDADNNPCDRHAILIANTLDAVDALPVLEFASSPQSFPALKATLVPGTEQ